MNLGSAGKTESQNGKSKELRHSVIVYGGIKSAVQQSM